MHSLGEKLINTFKSRTDLYDEIIRGNQIKSKSGRFQISFKKNNANYCLTFESGTYHRKFYLLLRKEPNSNIYEKTTIGELKKLYHPSIEDQLVEEIVRYVEHQIIFDEEVHDRFVKIDSQRTSQGIR